MSTVGAAARARSASRTAASLVESGAMRFIVNHVGATLYLSRPFVEDISGQVIDIFPGCDHLRTTCAGKFANGDNFGGFPYIPNINPFGGTAIV